VWRFWWGTLRRPQGRSPALHSRLVSVGRHSSSCLPGRDGDATGGGRSCAGPPHPSCPGQFAGRAGCGVGMILMKHATAGFCKCEGVVVVVVVDVRYGYYAWLAT
jgi:hypothetical protein